MHFYFFRPCFIHDWFFYWWFILFFRHSFTCFFSNHAIIVTLDWEQQFVIYDYVDDFWCSCSKRMECHWKLRNNIHLSKIFPFEKKIIGLRRVQFKPGGWFHFFFVALLIYFLVLVFSWAKKFKPLFSNCMGFKCLLLDS